MLGKKVGVDYWQKSCKEIYKSALINFIEEEYDSCLELLEWAISISDKKKVLQTHKLWRLKGLARHELGEFNLARECFNVALKINWEKDELFFVRGITNLKDSNEKEAFKDFKKALEINPNIIEKYLKVLQKKARKGNYKKAFNFINKLLFEKKYKEIYFSHRNYRGITKTGISYLKEFSSDFFRVICFFNEDKIINQDDSEFEKSCLKNCPTKLNYSPSSKTPIKISSTILRNFFSSNTILNKEQNHSHENWHIDNYSDLYNLIEYIKKTKKSFFHRSVEELVDLISIIKDYNINLFITINWNLDPPNNTAALYISEEKNIIINGDYLLNTYRICSDLTHELIHYFQHEENEGQPIGLEIEDSLVKKVAKLYKDLSSIDFINELEAYTYQDCPFFIRKLINKRNEISQLMQLSKKRLDTIEWISREKTLPKYKKNSKPNRKIDLRNF